MFIYLSKYYMDEPTTNIQNVLDLTNKIHCNVVNITI